MSGFAPGTLIGERYRMVALVGRGGMGEVYRADDLRLGQPVALKFLPAGREANPLARDRLLAEVRSSRMVSHPNVCRVYDEGEIGGRIFLTMEYIDGEDLASLLRRIGRLPAGKALQIARQLCAGLAAAHERGVLHRDLKPANVMIDGRGQARITDFGLAVELEPAASSVHQGPAHGLLEVSGTIAYMAPERFDGKPATVQSDLYALGLILYEIYVGKPAMSATTLEAWRRAHQDSTPSHPSTLIADIDPLVERAILRCLEKEPAKRPASAEQLAAALPGGDPLAAAIAAGETPSPELVAASGEEGTLPRRQAWLWFVSCLLALALAVPLGSLPLLCNLVPLNAPLRQVPKAREVLAQIGYQNAPADFAWTYKVDTEYLSQVLQARPPREWFTGLRAAPGVLKFCYRDGPRPLFAWQPFREVAVILADPPPRYEDDAYLELDGRGRLVFLMVGGIDRYQPARRASQPTNWHALFDAAGLETQNFTAAEPQWRPAVGADESKAWTGSADGIAVRVEASAYGGRPVEFMVVPAAGKPSSGPVPDSMAPRSAFRSAAGAFLTTTLLGCVAALGALARHNVKQGRGDRKNAYRVGAAVFVVETVYVLLQRHWTTEPFHLASVLVFLLGPPFFAGAATWLFYLGAEPFVRRRWPHLLIPWTRLLEGRWRDPLVGRSLLVGCVAALAASSILPGILSLLGRAFSMPIAAPRFESQSLDPVAGWFLADQATGWIGPVGALLALAVLLTARLIVRRDRPAWVVLVLVTLGMLMARDVTHEPWMTVSPAAFVIAAGLYTAALVIPLSTHGLLASSAGYAVFNAIQATPLTYDLTRWYAWRTVVVVLLVGGVIFWGFRNVLGRQTAFPVGALDE